MSDEWIMIKENRGDGSKSGPPKPTPNPLSLMERTNDTHDNESFESFESRFPVLHWDWESNPHQPGTWIGADPSSPTANDTNPLSDSVHDTRTLAKQYLTAAPIHAYPPPRRPTTTPNCGAWERLTTPPAPASPRLTTALPPSPQAVSPSPATKLPTPKPKPKRSPTLPGSYTSWMRDLEQPDPPPPTPAEDSPFQYPHTGVHVHPPQVPFSETYLPTYAQPPPGNTHPAEAHVHDLVASFEAMTVGELDNLAPSPIHVTPPTTAAPDPMTPSLLPTLASSNISQWGSPGLALFWHSPSPSPMLVPPSTPISHSRSASFPTPSPGRPNILRPASTKPFDSPVSSSPFVGPTPPPIVPALDLCRINNPSPSLSPWSPAPDSPDLAPVPLPTTWRCSVCTLANTASNCATCGALPPQWRCTRCTLHNDHHVMECQACGATKIYHSPVSPQPLSPISPTQITGEVIDGVGLGFNRTHEASSTPATSYPTHGSWMCPLCTYANEPGDQCTMCSTPRP